VRRVKRLVIFTEIISPYRIPVFNALAQIGGIDLHVVFLAETDPGIRDWHVYKNEIRFSYEVLPSYRKRYGKVNILLNRRVSAALRDSAPDVIIFGGYNYMASWEALFWARRNRVPFVLWMESTARDSRRNNRLIEALKSSFIGRCDGFLVPGEASFRYLITFHISPDRIYMAPNAVDNDFFGRAADIVRTNAVQWRLQLELPRRFFLFVGRIVREKGVFDLLEAYRGMHPDLRREIGLVFVGDGPARAELEQRAGDVTPGSIRFTGFVHRESLAGYYALADALVLPTHTDTWGLTVNEGMACGLPIVCTDVAGCGPDLVEEGRNGHVIPALDVGRLVQVLEELTRRPDKVHAMGEHSARRILQYSPQACASGMAQAASLCKQRYE
jgi:glycosyltransferase involved in cell wall biosynthesis